MSTKVRDHARFDAADAAEVVIASFACNICLQTPDLIMVTGGPGERKATTVCPHCSAVNYVGMSDAQAVQLWTMQRGRTYVHFAPEHW